jgi:hypothetical protein
MQKNMFSQDEHQLRLGRFASDPNTALIATGVENILTLAGAAASRYVEGNIPRW